MRITNIYCDSSGQGKAGDILCTVGLGSTASKWIKFEERWKKLLKKYAITSPLHMTDFANGSGQYASWKQNEEKRKGFQEEALKTIRKTVNKCFCVSACVDDLKQNQKEYEFPGKIGQEHPYCWCAIVLYSQINNWLQVHPENMGAVEVFFEKGDVGQDAFPARLKELYPTIPEPTITPNKSLAPLQAADLFAYEFRKDVIRKAEGSNPRSSFLEIQRIFGSLMVHRHYTLERLTRLCEKARFPKRNVDGLRPLSS